MATKACHVLLDVIGWGNFAVPRTPQTVGEAGRASDPEDWNPRFVVDLGAWSMLSCLLTKNFVRERKKKGLLFLKTCCGWPGVQLEAKPSCWEMSQARARHGSSSP